MSRRTLCDDLQELYIQLEEKANQEMEKSLFFIRK